MIIWSTYGTSSQSYEGEEQNVKKVVQIMHFVHILKVFKERVSIPDCKGTWIFKKLEILKNIHYWSFNTIPYKTILSVLAGYNLKPSLHFLSGVLPHEKDDSMVGIKAKKKVLNTMWNLVANLCVKLNFFFQHHYYILYLCKVKNQIAGMLWRPKANCFWSTSHCSWTFWTTVLKALLIGRSNF